MDAFGSLVISWMFEEMPSDSMQESEQAPAAKELFPPMKPVTLWAAYDPNATIEKFCALSDPF